jgi:hypothetical protein
MQQENLCGSQIWTNIYWRSLFTLTNTIVHSYNIFGRSLFSVTHSRTANLGEVSSALLGAQLSLALVGYELAVPLIGYKLY